MSYNLPKVAHILNLVNVMTYDFHGTWEDTTNFNSPFTEDSNDPSPPAAQPYWNNHGIHPLVPVKGRPGPQATSSPSAALDGFSGPVAIWTSSRPM